jgi:hypothetical protein
MSYDDTDVVRELYFDQQLTSLPIHYSLQTKRSAKELIIAPHRLALPSPTWRIQPSAKYFLLRKSLVRRGHANCLKVQKGCSEDLPYSQS